MIYVHDRSKKPKRKSKALARQKALIAVQRKAKQSLKSRFVELKPPKVYYREGDSNIPSLKHDTNTFNTAKKESNQYSGDYLVGIAVMHKSNLVPVGRNDDPKSYSTMRRN